MRFKGTMPETDTLLRIVQLLAKVSKKCILRLTPDDFVFILAGDSDSLVTWAGIPMVRGAQASAKTAVWLAHLEN
jgi:hypothetical protein